jgi:hypothetical protein
MAKPSPAAPALPLEFLWESLHQNCLGDRTLRAPQQDPEFPKARFRAHHIFDIANRAPRQCEIDIESTHWPALSIAPIMPFGQR